MLGRTSWRLLLLFYLIGGFCVSLPPTLHHGFSGPWRSPPALSSILAAFGCFTFARLFRQSFSASATVLSGRVLPTGLFYLAFLPHVLARFMTQMWAGTSHPGSSSVPALTKLSFLADAWSWTVSIVDTRPLVYQLCQWTTKYKFTKLICFNQPMLVQSDTTKLVNKYWLKLLQRNYFLSLH